MFHFRGGGDLVPPTPDPPLFKTFKNYIIIMTNISDKIRILCVWCCLLLIFELVQQAALVNFKLFMNILKILKISLVTFLRKHCISIDLWDLFSQKRCKAFRIAQCKSPELVKPCLNSDLYFISKPLLQLYQRQWLPNNPFQVSPRKTEKLLYLSLSFEQQLGKSKEFNNERMKAKVKRAFESFFVTKKIIKNRQVLHEIFFNLQ